MLSAWACGITSDSIFLMLAMSSASLANADELNKSPVLKAKLAAAPGMTRFKKYFIRILLTSFVILNLSIAKIGVLQRHIQILFFEHGHHRLQVVTFFSGDSHLLALNGGLHF